ncbi:hypothetical protein G5714_002752 [Onychostoma macrolepis]|uniref:Uncharacterized protein n=1 Tax=Onychostoma macrolepis TaxID=369639 RepID=A0A7J6D7L6_9TELE|nr:hypothetical protein G5714_002752 [Onychostoma macrolepis]
MYHLEELPRDTTDGKQAVEALGATGATQQITERKVSSIVPLRTGQSMGGDLVIPLRDSEGYLSLQTIIGVEHPTVLPRTDTAGDRTDSGKRTSTQWLLFRAGNR